MCQVAALLLAGGAACHTAEAVRSMQQLRAKVLRTG
jgi:hypothetical protein